MNFPRLIPSVILIVLMMLSEVAPPSAARGEGAIPVLTSTNTASRSNWKLIHTPKPDNSGQTASIMHTADTLNSDPDFAGIMVRCGDKGKTDALIVLVRPLAPRARPSVTIVGGSMKQTYEASLAAGGAAVLLPDDAGMLVNGAWQKPTTLAVEVRDNNDTIKGSVKLQGLAAAYAGLVSSCAP